MPRDLQPDIFDKDWQLTIWYRIDEFQLISLKIIAEAPRGLRPAAPQSSLSPDRPHLNHRRCSSARTSI